MYLISSLFVPYSQLICTLFAPYLQPICSLFVTYLYLICTLFAPYLYLICSLFVAYLTHSWGAADLKTRTAPRRERYFHQRSARRLDGSHILEALGCSGGAVLYFQISPLGTPSPERVNRSKARGNRVTQRFAASALEGYLFSFCAPDRGTLSTTEVSS